MLRLPSVAYLDRRCPQDACAILDSLERELTDALEDNRTAYDEPRRAYWHRLISRKLWRVDHHRKQLGL